MVPLWLKIAYGVFVPFLIVVYWPRYGPFEFSLALRSCALHGRRRGDLRIAASRQHAGGRRPAARDFLDRRFLLLGRFGLTSYMFDKQYPLWLRGISLFHLALPPTLIWMLWKFGYDPVAFPLQIALTWAVLLFCYAFTDPEKNINWVFGPGEKPQKKIPRLQYFAILMVVHSAVRDDADTFHFALAVRAGLVGSHTPGTW
jgi:hypothetical protein